MRRLTETRLWDLLIALEARHAARKDKRRYRVIKPEDQPKWPTNYYSDV